MLQSSARAESGEIFLTCMREETRALHRVAERSGIYASLLAGSANRLGYGLLLRNLHPVYEQLERGLDECDALRPLARHDVYRAPAIARDLVSLFGTDWRDALPRLPAGTAYAERVRVLRLDSPKLLLSHAYTRYLGDLSGGRVLRRLLARYLRLSPTALTFYEYPPDVGASGMACQYRAAIITTATSTGAGALEVEEAIAAFSMNIELSIAVHEFAQAAAPLA